MTAKNPFQIPPAGMQKEIVEMALPEDERLWMPHPDMPSVWSRPLFANTVSGEWIDVLRVRRSGFLSRHRHPGPVFGYVIKGSWHYLEHDWVAHEGSFVFEPPGEVHTLMVDDCEEMITLFHIHGSIIFIDEAGNTTGFEDVFVKIEQWRQHFIAVGLGERYIDQYVR